jgi:putative DNA primase/helicase
LLPVANGLLHLPSNKLLKQTPEFFSLHASDVSFETDAPAPVQWLTFLHDLFQDDEQSIETLQEWFGHTLSPDTSQQKILLGVGPTRSGKGTIARVQTGLVGRDSVAAPTLQGLSSNFGLEVLIGKPLAIISDARLGARSDQAAIAERLLSISGEDAITIDRKFKSSWTGRLGTRFMLLTNELPRLNDSSGALARRFVVLVLRRSFYGQEDPHLTDKLLAELPGILNWALVGYARLRQRGYFVQAESAREAIEDLEALASPVSAFVRDCCNVGVGLQVAIDALYSKWDEWCRSNGRRDAGNKETFGKDLKAAFSSIRVRRLRGEDDNRVRVYEGISLT